MNTQYNMGEKGHWIIMFTHHSSFDCSSYNTTIQLEFPRTLRTSKKCGQICASGRFVMRINAVLYHQYATVFLTHVCNHLKFLIFVKTLCKIIFFLCHSTSYHNNYKRRYKRINKSNRNIVPKSLMRF